MIDSSPHGTIKPLLKVQSLVVQNEIDAIFEQTILPVLQKAHVIETGSFVVIA
ncbi:MAG: hypothetical protein ACREBJ_02285 [Nitrosotalea sp.]